MAEIEITVEFLVDRLVFFDRELKPPSPPDDRTASERKLDRRQEMDTADAMGVGLRVRRAVYAASECVEAIRVARDELSALPDSLPALATASPGWVIERLTKQKSSTTTGR